jgi:hypothetical protein
MRGPLRRPSHFSFFLSFDRNGLVAMFVVAIDLGVILQFWNRETGDSSEFIIFEYTDTLN